MLLTIRTNTTLLWCLNLLHTATFRARRTPGSVLKHLSPTSECSRAKKGNAKTLIHTFPFRITLALCDEAKRSQKFELTYKKDVKVKGLQNTCWDFQGGIRQEIQQYGCHGQHGNQLFKYVSMQTIRSKVKHTYLFW